MGTADLDSFTTAQFAAFKTAQGQINSVGKDMKALSKATSTNDRELTGPTGSSFLWAAAVSKYFAAILVPTAKGEPGGDWVGGKWGVYYNPDLDPKHNRGDDNHTLNDLLPVWVYT